jgi:phage terminase small subunit
MKHAPGGEPRLTPKQEAFARVYIETGNASEAYRRAYNAKNMNAASINVNACKLLKHAKIALRVAEFHEQAEVKTLLTFEQHLEELKILRDIAKSAGQLSAAINAEVKRGELMRFYVKQVESTRVNEYERMSDAELEAIIQEGYEQIQVLKAQSAESPKMLTSNGHGHDGRGQTMLLPRAT